MPQPAPDSPYDAGESGSLSRIFVLIVVVEMLSMAALYWVGRHFGA